MMPVVRISDGTWERLKSHARPFEDSPDDVIKLALDALEGKRSERDPQKARTIVRRRRLGNKLPQTEFRLPLLNALIKFGGGAPVSKIREEVFALVSSKLLSSDRDPVSTGDPRWWNATCWERNQLVKEGLMKSDSPRGFWEITEEGKRAAS